MYYVCLDMEKTFLGNIQFILGRESERFNKRKQVGCLRRGKFSAGRSSADWDLQKQLEKHAIAARVQRLFDGVWVNERVRVRTVPKAACGREVLSSLLFQSCKVPTNLERLVGPRGSFS